MLIVHHVEKNPNNQHWVFRDDYFLNAWILWLSHKISENSLRDQ
jgi:hypothetical protein